MESRSRPPGQKSQDWLPLGLTRQRSPGGGHCSETGVLVPASADLSQALLLCRVHTACQRSGLVNTRGCGGAGGSTAPDLTGEQSRDGKLPAGSFGS